MKKILLIATILTSAFLSQAKSLHQAIIHVESSDRVMVVGDNGKAKGLYQIQPIVIKDVNRIYKTNYKHNDAFNPELAQEIFDKYTSYWAKYYQKKTGKAITNEVIARIWNGGPMWFKKPHKTNKYWTKVKKALNS